MNTLSVAILSTLTTHASWCRGKTNPHTGPKAFAAMRQNEVRATEHNNTPAEGKATRPSQKQPDTQREGPGRQQGTNPKGEGKHQSQGRGANNSQTNDRKRRPNHPQKGARRPRTDAHSRAAETPTQRNHSQRGATHERKQNTRPRTTDGRESTAQIKTAPNQPTRQTKKGATRGQNPTEARKRIPTTPQQVGANRNVAPKERGHRR